MTALIQGYAHVGIRVHSLERSLAFYTKLGFVLEAGPIGPEPVAILVHPCGIELNLILNAAAESEPNILMDVPVKHAGYTHMSLLVSSLDAMRAHVESQGIALSGGPVQFTPTSRGFFVRDPDRNVVEFHERHA